MKVYLESVSSVNLDKYSKVLNKFNAIYKYSYAVIEIQDLKELFELSKELERDLIIDHSDNSTMIIYDGFIE